ncbi:MAG: hypothetical protein EZS28_039102 [Streblomastix strix]|uniref:Uncharacterized protein n=1 Tax=Streblomastix strix TaxID=222440 RepID=A0A5J4U616_9EUKA|nr:MAG: hypothetical protein EZS28_039102 [Streblomastix strix]
MSHMIIEILPFGVNCDQQINQFSPPVIAEFVLRLFRRLDPSLLPDRRSTAQLVFRQRQAASSISSLQLYEQEVNKT